MNFDEAKRQAAYVLWASGMESNMLLFFEHKGGTKYVRTNDFSDTVWLRSMIKKEIAFLASELYYVSYRGDLLLQDDVRSAILEEAKKKDCDMKRIRDLAMPAGSNPLKQEAIVVERHHRKEGMDIVHLRLVGKEVHEFPVEGSLVSEFDVWNKVQIELKEDDNE